MHRRVMHGYRCAARVYAAADGVCIACGTKFGNRPRLIAHLSDPRRSKCFDWCAEFGSPLSGEVVESLDLEDRKLRAHFRKLGHSCVQSQQQAVSKWEKAWKDSSCLGCSLRTVLKLLFGFASQSACRLNKFFSFALR